MTHIKIDLLLTLGEDSMVQVLKQEVKEVLLGKLKKNFFLMAIKKHQ